MVSTTKLIFVSLREWKEGDAYGTASTCNIWFIGTNKKGSMAPAASKHFRFSQREVTFPISWWEDNSERKVFLSQGGGETSVSKNDLGSWIKLSAHKFEPRRSFRYRIKLKSREIVETLVNSS